MKKRDEEEDERRAIDNVNEVYSTDPDGTYSKAGSEEAGSMPNDPAKNAKLTSPEEDAKNGKKAKDE